MKVSRHWLSMAVNITKRDNQTCSSWWTNISPLGNNPAKKFKPESTQATESNYQLWGNAKEGGCVKQNHRSSTPTIGNSIGQATCFLQK